MKPLAYLIFVLAFWSCSSPDKKAGKSSPKEDSVPVAAQKSDTSSVRKEAQGRHSHTVEIKQMKFIPEEIRISKGDTIIWKNDDLVTHCITEKKTKDWTSGQLPDGGSWKKVFTESADYYCAIHQVMKGKITVE